MNHYHILANTPEEQVSVLATSVLRYYTHGQITLLSGPQQGVVMMRVRETVAESVFHAGEILVTEVKLELDGQFGFGMIIGDNSRRALAVALVDAALRKGGPCAAQLSDELALLDQHNNEKNQREQALVAATKVDFERM